MASTSANWRNSDEAAPTRGRGRGGARGRGSARGSKETAAPKRSIIPSTEPSTPSRPQNRRKRSKTPSTASLRPQPLDDSLLKPPKANVKPAPHSAPIRDPPPHLASHFDIRTDIDALVERVRAVAMSDNRPTTPGSHIDWAGDEDDTLPDLDDWGVKTADQISPIMVDGLRALPDPVPTLISPQKLHPSLPDKPVVPVKTAARSLLRDPVDTARSFNKPQTKLDVPDLHPKPASTQKLDPSPPEKTTQNKPVRSILRDQSSPQKLDVPDLPPKPISAPSDMTSYPTRSQPTSFHRFTRSGGSTPSEAVARHARTHSTPPSLHKASHSRPIITGDAIARLTRTINAAGPRTAKD